MKHLYIWLGLAGLLSACGGGTNVRGPAPTVNRPAPAPEREASTPEDKPRTRDVARYLGKFRNTWYCLALEAEHKDDPGREKVYDPGGQVLAEVSRSFKKDLDMEGSGKLLDARVLNFASYFKGQFRYHFTRNAYGDGVGNCPLVPFHTIAVDPKMIPLGSVVRIRETVGMHLPDGSVHDGLWRAEDVGAAIKGDRMDLFVGAGQASGRIMDRNGIQNMAALSVEVVEESAPTSCVYNFVQPLEDSGD